MPTYEYECPNGHTFDAFQKMTEEPVSTCPECGEPARRKISGGAGFLFKGEGFYITDYRSEEYKKKQSSETGEASKGSGAKGGTDSGSSAKASESGGSKGSKTQSDE